MATEALRFDGNGLEPVEELRASRFTLVDRRGDRRAELAIDEDDATSLQMYGAGEKRVALSVEASGAAHLELCNQGGEGYAWLSVDPQGSPSLYLSGVSRGTSPIRGHVGLAVDGHGTPIVSLHDHHGEPRLLLSLRERDGSPVFSFSDVRGDMRTVLDDVDVFEVPPVQPERAAAAPDATPAPSQPQIDPVLVTRTRVAQELDAVLRRLERTERQVRRARRTTAASLLLALVACGLAAMLQRRAPTVVPAAVEESTTKVGATVVEATEIVLRGKDGSTRGRIGTFSNGTPYVLLAAPDGYGSAELTAAPGGGASLQLRNGGSLVALGRGENGSPEVAVYGSTEGARAGLSVHADGVPALRLSDREGRVRVNLTLGADGAPSFSLFDREGPRAVLSSADASASLALLGPVGRWILESPR